MVKDKALSDSEKHERIRQLEDELNTLKQSLQQVDAGKRFEHIYEQVFHHGLQGNILIIDGVIADANSRMTAITGYSIDELRQMTTKNLNALVHPDDIEAVIAAYEEHNRTTPSQAFHNQHRIIRKDGQIRWIDVISNLLIVNGKPIVHSCSIDVTAEHQSMETMRYQSFLLENISDAVISCDTDFYIKSWNQSAEELYGWTEAEVIGKNLNNLLHPIAEQSQLADLDTQLRQDGTWRGEYILHHRDGHPIAISASINLLRNNKELPIGIVAVHRDISEHKKLEGELEDLVKQRTLELEEINRQLRISEGRYRTLIHHFPNGIVGLINPDLTFDLIDGKGIEWTNLQAEDVKGKRLDEIFGAEIAERDEAAIREALAGKSKESVIEYGDMAFRVHTLPIENENGTISGAMLMTQNISELKQVENALRISEQRYRTLLESISDAIVVIDWDWHYLYVNSTFEQFVQRKQSELIGKRVIDVFPFFAKMNHYQVIQQAMDKRVSGFVTEKFKQVDQTYRWYKSFVYPTPDGIMIITRDTTYEHEHDEQQLQIQLAQNRAKALDELIHNLSHDLRTPLSVINTSLYLMENYQDPQRQQAKLQSIKKQVQTLEKMLGNILLMTRLDQLDRLQVETTQVNQLLLNLIEQNREQIEAKSLEVTVALAEPPVFARINSEFFAHALAHVFENALIYTQDEGHITLRLTQDQDTQRIAIEIIDDGMGITAEDLPHVFERFYRANRARTLNDAGSGLGLTLADRIVKLHGGRIQINSRAREGTMIIIYL